MESTAPARERRVARRTSCSSLRSGRDMRNPHAAAQTPWSDDVRRSLLAERLAVALERNDAALRAGRHTEVLVDLIVETRARPLDERLSGQPTPAPSRSGRQAAAYQAIRWRLLNELGVDPGAELRGSQQLILRGEATTDPRTTPTAPCAVRFPTDARSHSPPRPQHDAAAGSPPSPPHRSTSLTRGGRGGKVVLVDAEHTHLPVQGGTRYAKPRGCGELVPTSLDQCLHHDVALGTLQR